jgi:hypothetical protein
MSGSLGPENGAEKAVSDHAGVNFGWSSVLVRPSRCDPLHLSDGRQNPIAIEVGPHQGERVHARVAEHLIVAVALKAEAAQPDEQGASVNQLEGAIAGL